MLINQLSVWTGSQWPKDLKKLLPSVALMVVSSSLANKVELKKTSLKHINPPSFPSSGVTKVLP